MTKSKLNERDWARQQGIPVVKKLTKEQKARQYQAWSKRFENAEPHDYSQYSELPGAREERDRVLNQIVRDFLEGRLELSQVVRGIPIIRKDGPPGSKLGVKPPPAKSPPPIKTTDSKNLKELRIEIYGDRPYLEVKSDYSGMVKVERRCSLCTDKIFFKGMYGPKTCMVCKHCLEIILRMTKEARIELVGSFDADQRKIVVGDGGQHNNGVFETTGYNSRVSDHPGLKLRRTR